MMAQKPNVLLVFADDMSPFLTPWIENTHPLYGKTPNFDSLIQKSTVFKKTVVQQPVCGPSRASFLSGRLPDTTKIWNFDRFLTDVHPEIQTIGKYLVENEGYTHSRGFGKVFHPHSYDKTDYDPDHYYGTGHYTSPVRAFDKTGNSECSQGKLYCDLSKSQLTDQNVNDEVKSFIRNRNINQDGPWLAYVGYRRPHTDFSVPSNYINGILSLDSVRTDQFTTDFPSIEGVTNWKESLAYYECAKLNDNTVQKTQGSSTYTKINDIATGMTDNAVARTRWHYYMSIMWVDELLGDLLQTLEDEGFSDNTIVMFFSDHGWANQEHGIFCKNNLFPIGTDVPFIVHVPDIVESHGKISNRPTQLIDIFPTIIDLIDGSDFDDNTGLPLDGLSFKDSLHNNNIEIGHIKAFSQYPRCSCNEHVLSLIQQDECPDHVWTQKAIDLIQKNVQFHPCTTNQADFDSGQCNRPPIIFMGYTVVTTEYRYVEWRFFRETQLSDCKTYSNSFIVKEFDTDNTGTLWNIEPIQRELYVVDDSPFYKSSVDNIASNPLYANVVSELSIEIKNKYTGVVTDPPTIKPVSDSDDNKLLITVSVCCSLILLTVLSVLFIRRRKRRIRKFSITKENISYEFVDNFIK